MGAVVRLLCNKEDGNKRRYTPLSQVVFPKFIPESTYPFYSVASIELTNQKQVFLSVPCFLPWKKTFSRTQLTKKLVLQIKIIRDALAELMVFMADEKGKFGLKSGSWRNN
jgi:hypothetical protein